MLSTAKFWAAVFKRSIVFVKDNRDRPNEVTNSKIIEIVQIIVLSAQRMKVHEIAEILSIPFECLQNILKTHLVMKKLSGKWKARQLRTDNKHAGMYVNFKNYKS